MKRQRYRYYGTPDPMTEREAYHCEKYLKRKKDRIIQVGRFLLDSDSLLAPFHLDCGNCRSVHGQTCCEGGQPYSVDKWQMPLIEATTPKAVAAFLQGRSAHPSLWCAQGYSPGSIPLHEGSCYFYGPIGEGHGCILHAYAEKKGEEVYPLKPFSCQLYPLDLIQIEEKVLITAVTEETAAFSRWGNDYLKNFYCASLERRKAADHLPAEVFAVAGYRPAYQWGNEFLQETFGTEAELAFAKIKESIIRQQPPQ